MKNDAPRIGGTHVPGRVHATNVSLAKSARGKSLVETGSRSRMDSGLSVEVLADAMAFERLKGEWDELLDASQQQYFYFLRYDWNQLWWQYFAPSNSHLYIVTCRDARDRLVGLAPLYWKQLRLLGLPNARELRFLGLGVETKTSEYLNIIARGGCETAVAEAMADCLRKRPDWDRMRLEQVPADSTTLPRFVAALGGETISRAWDRAPYIDTSVGWEMFKRSLGRSMRRNVEYYSRRLFKRHRCDFKRATTSAEHEQAIEALVRLHQARWRSVGQSGSFAGSELTSVLHQLLRTDAHVERVRLWTLSIDDKIEAVLLGFLDNGVLHYFQKGFNPEFAKEDLGTAMLGLCIRDCFDDPSIRAFDFMGGGATYKELWARLSRETVLYEVNRSNLRTLLYSSRTFALEFCTTAYRTLAPLPVRAARRDLLQRLRTKRQVMMDTLAQSVLPVLYSTAALAELLIL